jgi:heme/copper-type cytochrome/quinol oxidase subunit 3
VSEAFGPPPHTARADPGPPAARVARSRVAEPNGWWGMLLFVLSEATVFGSLIGTYYYLDFHVAHWPPTGIALPSVTAPALDTAGLALTGPMLWVAMRAVRAGRKRPAMAWIALGLAVQAAYLGIQIVLYKQQLGQFSPRSTAYGSIYFTILAADHAHVIVGLILSVAILWKLWRQGLTSYWLVGARGLALYWYVVIAITIAVTLTTLSPSL